MSNIKVREFDGTAFSITEANGVYMSKIDGVEHNYEPETGDRDLKSIIAAFAEAKEKFDIQSFPMHLLVIKKHIYINMNVGMVYFPYEKLRSVLDNIIQETTTHVIKL